jgi:hypothetical protein
MSPIAAMPILDNPNERTYAQVFGGATNITEGQLVTALQTGGTADLATMRQFFMDVNPITDSMIDNPDFVPSPDYLVGFSTANNAGSILVNATPLPEPGSVALLAVGGLALLRRRRH